MAKKLHRQESLTSSFALWSLNGVVGAIWLFAGSSSVALEQRLWESTPYRVEVEFCCDSSLPGNTDLAEHLISSLRDRVDGRLRPRWQMHIAEALPERRKACRQMVEAPYESLPTEAQAADKFVQLCVVVEPLGIEIRTREFDLYVRRWSRMQRRRVFQRTVLEEACFAVLYETLAPIAAVEVDVEDPERVRLLFRGNALKTRAEEPIVAPETVLVPLLRRATRTGELRVNGVNPIAWTYVVADQYDASGWSARVHSGLRRPFAARRQGLVEQLGLAVRPSEETTRVRFYSRHDQTQALPGYDVFEQLAGGETRLVGVTDGLGMVQVGVTDQPVVDLFLRSDGLLLAKAPIVPGLESLVDVPIADDPARLRAQAEVRTLREELIDLVAHRAILMGRIRTKLGASDRAGAKKLMDELNNLPLQSSFDRRIDTAERANRSSDPKVQQRIAQLFTDTRQMLARFLNVRQINDLQSLVNE